MQNLSVIQKEGKFVVDSREVAVMVDRRHDHLLRDIKGYVEIIGISTQPNFGVSDFFIENTYQDSTGRTLPCYLLTKKGCDMVANKMTGEKGVLFTAMYVTKFEEMENQLSHKLPRSYKEALLSLVESEEEKERLQLENKQKDQIINELQPKATYYDLILQTPNALSVSQIAKDYGWSATKLNTTLNELGVQYKQGGTWLLYQKFAEFGYTQSKTHNYINTKTNIMESALHTYWTQKGRIFIYELLKNKKGKLPLVEDIKE